VKIVDLGLSNFVKDGVERGLDSAESLPFMSPQVVGDWTTVDGYKADSWSVG
jgi:hypothetical protein